MKIEYQINLIPVKKRIVTIVINLLIGLQIPISTFGQIIETPYFNYTINDGLPSNLVYSSLLDKDGLLWISTDAGVVLFDGNASKVFTTKDGLPSNDIYHMFCDSKNRIWFTSLKSDISYYQNGKIYNQYSDPKRCRVKTSGNFPRYFEDKNGDVWARFSPFELLKLTGSYKIHINNVENDFRINFSLVLPDSLIYFSSAEFTYFVNPRNGSIRRKRASNYKYVRAISYIDSIIYFKEFDGKLDFIPIKSLPETSFGLHGMFDGIYKIDSNIFCNDNGKITIEKFCKKKPIFEISPLITTTYLSNKSCLFLGSYNKGLLITNSIPSYTICKGQSVSTVKLSKNLKLIGLSNGEMVKVENWTFDTIKFSKSRSLNKISKLILNGNSYLCITNTHLIKGSLISKYFTEINCFSADYKPSFKNIYLENDTIILLTSTGIFRIKNISPYPILDSHFFGKRGYSYIRYKNQDIIGTQDMLYELKTKLIPFKTNLPFSKRIMDLCSDDNFLYVLTSESGLYVIDGHNILDNLNVDNGLSSNNCGKALLYKNELFICTDKGISIYNTKTHLFSYLFESDGLASNMVNDIAIFQDTIYAATEDGLSVIPYSTIIRNKEFDHFAKPYGINNDTIWARPSQITSRTDKTIFFVLNGTSYIRNSKKTYFYRILEKDSSFQRTLDKNILLTFNKPGNYTLESYCVNAEGTKSKLLSIPIFIKPYFYQTIWFYLALFILLLALIFLVSRYYANLAKIKEQKKAAEEKRIRGLELAAWRATVNPHFLFNSLNGFQAFFRRNEFDKGNFYLSTFTQMLRNTVDSSSDITITVEQEIEFLREFLEFEQNKKEKIFKFKIEVDQASTLDLFIPTLLVQQVLENCIKHAFLDDKEGFVLVRFSTENEQLVARIRDNGPGLQISEKEAKKSVGIALIRYKMRIVEKLVNSPTDFLMKNVIDKKGNPAGLETTLVFPLITKRLKIDMHEQQEDENTVIEMIEDDNLNPENDDEELNSRKSENAD